LAWQSDSIEGTNLVISVFSLTMDIKPRWSNYSFYLTMVYGPTDEEAEQLFLAELISLEPNPVRPWVEISTKYMPRVTKINSNLNQRNMGRFRHALDNCEFFELSLQNYRYTWSNERHDPTLVRLDRAFCNMQWDLMLPGFSLQALSSAISSHCPIMLCQQLRPRKKEVFHFKKFWVKVSGFREVVQEAWDKPKLGISLLNILHYKLQNAAKSLKSWSKHHQSTSSQRP
jgi:hypothetical protein